LDRGHHRQDVAVGSRDGGHGEHRVGEHDLTCRARLGVDDGRRAGDGDCLFDSSDSQFGIDRRHASAGQLDALALDRGEAGDRERQAVGAGFQIDDAVLAAPIRHDGARLLDERRARRFDVHAGQDGAGRIADGAGDGWLGK